MTIFFLSYFDIANSLSYTARELRGAGSEFKVLGFGLMGIAIAHRASGNEQDDWKPGYPSSEICFLSSGN